MPRHKRYNPRLIDVIFQEEHSQSWKMAGRVTRGWEAIYNVEDRNFGRLKRWIFAIRTPKQRSGNIVVQPVHAPPKRVWAGLDRRSIVFVRATKHPYRSTVYCKVNLADPYFIKTKVGTSRGQRGLLPKWFDYFRPYMRLKNTVTTTAGHDGDAQVVVMDPQDHDRMIRLFIALKAWVLQEGIVVEK